MAGMVKPVTVWDGIKLFFMEEADAITAALAGTVQVWDGPLGYRPGYYMKPGSAFPLTAYPANTLTSILPASAEQGTGPVPIVLTGTDFTEDTEVLLDGVSTSSIFVNSTTINVTIPNNANVVAIAVKVRDAFNRESAVQTFNYTATP